MVVNEILKNIYEEYKIIKEEKKRIESKIYKTKADLEDLEAIEELHRYLLDKFNNEYQKQNNEKNTRNANNQTINPNISLIIPDSNLIKTSSNKLELENYKETLKKEISNIIDNEKGKKQFVKYKGKQYYIPIRCKGNFLYLLHELEKTNNDLNKINEIQKHSDDIDTNEVSAGLNKFLDNYIIGHNEQKAENDTQKELIQKSEAINISDSHPQQQIELIDISRKSTKNSTKKIAKKPLIGFVEKIRKPLKNIKKETKIKIALVVTTLILIVTGSAKYSNNKPDGNDKTYSTSTEYQLNNGDGKNIDNSELATNETDAENTLNKPDTTKTQDKIESANKENRTKEMQQTENIDNKIKIGSTIKINEGAKIYQNNKDAYLEENSLRPYYSNEDTRVILGVAVETINGIDHIFANDPIANNKLDKLISNGGKIISILTANKERYLQDYNEQDILHEDEINAYAEGWYNVNDIEKSNTKGKTL